MPVGRGFIQGLPADLHANPFTVEPQKIVFSNENDANPPNRQAPRVFPVLKLTRVSKNV